MGNHITQEWELAPLWNSRPSKFQKMVPKRLTLLSSTLSTKSLNLGACVLLISGFQPQNLTAATCSCCCPLGQVGQKGKQCVFLNGQLHFYWLQFLCGLWVVEKALRMLGSFTEKMPRTTRCPWSQATRKTEDEAPAPQRWVSLVKHSEYFESTQKEGWCLQTSRKIPFDFWFITVICSLICLDFSISELSQIGTWNTSISAKQFRRGR